MAFWESYILNFLYVVGFASLVYGYRSPNQKQVLFFNGLSGYIFVVYFLIQDSYAAAISVGAAGMGSTLQLYLVSQGKDSVSRSRVIVSTVFTLLGMAAVYSGPPDVYIMLAVAAARYGELSDDPRKIKMGYLIAEALWLIYAAEVGMFPVYCGCLVLSAILFYQIIKDYRGLFVYYKSQIWEMGRSRLVKMY